MAVSAKKEIACLTLDEAVAVAVANDDLEVPEGHKAVEYLSGVVSLVLIAEIYGAALNYHRGRLRGAPHF